MTKLTDEQDFERRVYEMDVDELRQRILTQASSIRSYQECLDGLGIGDGVEGHWRPDGIRKLVKSLMLEPSV